MTSKNLTTYSHSRPQVNFLGLGFPKCGTTWLHHILDMHPQVYVPAVKEVHFFSKFYDRGSSWYLERNFAEARSQHIAVGEFSTSYIYFPEAAERIKEWNTIDRFIVMLRNPVERLISAYWETRRVFAHNDSLEDFIKYSPAIPRSNYIDYLPAYLDVFGRDPFLFLIYEEVFADVDFAASTLKDFLGLSSMFEPNWLRTRVNPRRLPHPIFRPIAKWINRGGKYLLAHDLSWLYVLGKRLSLHRLPGKTPPPILSHTREKLLHKFSDDIKRLEDLLGRELDIWLSSNENKG